MAEERLAKAKLQLTQVEQLLEEEPSNPELLGLADDLRQAVCVAEALVAKQVPGPSTSGWVSIHPPSTTTATTTTSSWGEKNSPSVVRLGEYLPGDHVEVRTLASQKNWQGAVIKRRLPDYTYVVLRLCDDKELTLRGDGILLRDCAEPAQLKLDRIVVGMKVRARYSGDGKYYQASVSKVSSDGVFVKFEGFEEDEDEHVMLEHCRESEPGEAPSLLQMDTPRHLIVTVNDSEEVKAKKQRQLRALRRKLRDEQIDQVHSVKQDHWLTFQASSHHNLKRVKQ